MKIFTIEGGYRWNIKPLMLKCLMAIMDAAPSKIAHTCNNSKSLLYTVSFRLTLRRPQHLFKPISYLFIKNVHALNEHKTLLIHLAISLNHNYLVQYASQLVTAGM